MDSKLESFSKGMLRFLDILSHELRNPIATIVSGLELLDMSAGKDKFDKTKGILLRQTTQLCYLVDELLDHTRIASNKMQLQKEQINLNQLALLAIENYNLLFKEKEIALSMVEEEQPPIYIERLAGVLPKKTVRTKRAVFVIARLQGASSLDNWFLINIL